MTQTGIFTPDEIATLEALYPDRDEWFMYLYLLSDRVQEEDEGCADGMRFLCAIRQRPFTWGKRSESLSGKYCMAGSCKVRFKDQFQNKVPMEADPWGWHFGVAKALSVFLYKWASLPADTRSKLWREWVMQ